MTCPVCGQDYHEGKTCPNLGDNQAVCVSCCKKCQFQRNPANFNRECGGRYCNGFPVEPDMKLVRILDKLREEGKPINITSGIRCKKFNASLDGSSPTSAHMDGDAADFNIYGVTEKTAERARLKKRLYELGVYYTYSDTPGMGIAIHAEV